MQKCNNRKWKLEGKYFSLYKFHVQKVNLLRYKFYSLRIRHCICITHEAIEYIQINICIYSCMASTLSVAVVQHDYSGDRYTVSVT